MQPVSTHLNVTMDCNFRCQYCFVHHQPSTMAPETARKAIDWLMTQQPGQMRIELFGGEPFLNREAMRAAVEHAKRNYSGRIRFGVVTNCSLLTDDDMDWLAENRFTVLASCDGIMTQDVRCPGSFPAISGAIRSMLARGIHVNAAMTLVPGHTQHLMANFRSLAGLGLRNIAINYVVSGYRPYNEEDFHNISEQYAQMVEYLLADRLQYGPAGRVHCNLFERHLPGIKAKAIGQYKLPPDWLCGACKGSLGIWPDGTIMPCHELSPETYPHWKLGNVLTGEFEEPRCALFTADKRRDCDLCEVTNCGHCRARAFERTGDEMAYLPDQCRYQRLLYTKAIDLWNELVRTGRHNEIR